MKRLSSSVKKSPRPLANGDDSVTGPSGGDRGAALTSSAGVRFRSAGRMLATKELRRDQLQLQSLVIPGILILLVFNYVPMWGVVLAFQDYNIFRGVLGSEWVGFEQFRRFFTDRNFANIMRNTVVISVLKIVVGFPAPIMLALVLNEVTSRGFKRITQTITYLPHFLSWVVVSGMVLSMLNVSSGSVNELLVAVGIIERPIAWLSEPRYFWGILVSANVWKNIGFGSIIYLAAIAGINPELYEAAEVDGAGRLKKILLITIPGIAPQIIVLLILRVSQVLNAGFQDILLLTNNGTNAILREVSEVIDTYVFRVGLQNRRFSYGTAVGLFKSVINILTLWSANAISRRISETSLW